MIAAGFDGREGLVSVSDSPAAELTVAVEPAHTTTHLPSERAVITTPALVALMEQCIATAETRRAADGGRWLSVAADVRHRAGARTGETLNVRAERTADARDDRAAWAVSATAADGRLIAEGTVERAWEAPCPR